MNRENRFALLMCVAYGLSLLLPWSAVDTSIDGISVAKTKYIIVIMAGILMIVLGSVRKPLNGKMIIIGACIVLFSELVYILFWPIPNIHDRVDLSFSINCIQMGAYISGLLALILLFLGIKSYFNVPKSY